jgi:hypothetical protein
MEACNWGFAGSGAITVSRQRLCAHFSNDDFEDDRLAFRDEGPLAGCQLGHKRQLQSLHCRFDAPQTMAANQNFMRGEDQPELLLLSLGLEFGKDEIAVRQQQ